MAHFKYFHEQADHLFADQAPPYLRAAIHRAVGNYYYHLRQKSSEQYQEHGRRQGQTRSDSQSNANDSANSSKSRMLQRGGRRGRGGRPLRVTTVRGSAGTRRTSYQETEKSTYSGADDQVDGEIQTQIRENGELTDGSEQ